MPNTARQRNNGELFPPFEVGSFVSLRSDKSEFIGSASGIFFVNTVFRAFATSSGPSTQQAEADTGNANPDLASIHSCLAVADAAPEQTTDDVVLDILTSPEVLTSETAPGPSYGINIPGLGVPPSPADAKRLLMIYFQKWHAFFPFLHGPTFFAQVNQLYNNKPSENDGGSCETLRVKLCRAVCFQCVFNIAANSADEQGYLQPRSRITSPSVLTSLTGIIANGQDITALQALLAAELYLVTRMSSRAASAVHGSLTRVSYQAGLHRCPFRYVQLPTNMRIIRQRIWWCIYVLDRYLSVSLGHPITISDDEVDVCVPGMPELHKPVQHSSQPSSSTASDELRSHLPIGHRLSSNQGNSAEEAQRDTVDAHSLDAQSPARNPEEIGSFILGYMVTYSRLFGEALRMFHTSIHKRSVCIDGILDMTSRIHSWWNSLPTSFQGDDADAGSKYGAAFALLYYYLLLFVNRPFLSLPTHRDDFRFSLQTALGASRAIIQQARAKSQNPLILDWPGTLSAVWMSGLVVAYASLLKMYPTEKSIVDLNESLSLLETMGHSWTSANHCRGALKLMLEHLRSRSVHIDQVLSRLSPRIDGRRGAKRPHETFDTSEETRRKSQRQSHHQTQQAPPRDNMAPTPSVEPDALYADVWQPVLEYTGPDFGFDAYQFSREDAWQDFLTQGLNPGLSDLLFDSDGWNSYVQTFEGQLRQ